MNANIRDLKLKAIDIRRDIAELAAHGKGGGVHVGPGLSSVEILTALYFHIMEVNPEDPKWDLRDRFVLSKGHGYASYYGALAERGFFPREEILTTRVLHSRLQGHPSLGKTPGVDMTSGSLGNGFGCAMGIALGMKLKNMHRRKVYTLIGDGECNEGLIWEVAMAAPHLNLDNMVAIVDCNKHQSNGSTKKVLDMHPMDEKWASFGWKVFEMNGHDMEDVVRTLDMAKEYEGRPVCILAHTVKGKGFSFTEHNNQWHVGRFNKEQYEIATEELNRQKAELLAGAQN